MASILDLVKLAEESSKEYEPGKKYGVSGDTPRVGAFGTMYDKPFPWSERKLRTYSTGSDEFKEKKGKERKVEYLNQLTKDILGKEKSIIEVFGEKSQDADIAKEEMIKLAMEIAIGSTPVGGSVKAGKGGISFLKELLKKSQKPSGIRQFGKFNRQLQKVPKRNKDISIVPLRGKKGFDVLDSGEMKHYRVSSEADAQTLANQLLKPEGERSIKHLLKSK